MLKSSTDLAGGSGDGGDGGKNASGRAVGDDKTSLFGGVLADDAGSPGYFSTNLSSGVRVELTASRRTALHRYTFPSRPVISDDQEGGGGREGDVNIDVDWRPRILVDITSDGDGSGVVDVDSVRIEKVRELERWKHGCWELGDRCERVFVWATERYIASVSISSKIFNHEAIAELTLCIDEPLLDAICPRN